MNQREQLIEKAAKAIYGALPAAVIVPWEDLRLAGRDEMRAKAREVRAVFEEASTPSEDEREALGDIVNGVLVSEGVFDAWGAPSMDYDMLVRAMQDAVLAADFHRTTGSTHA